MTKSYEISKKLVWEAYQCVKGNDGSAGVDRESIAQFESHLKDNLYKLWNRMSSGSYFPSPVKGVPIPKKSGGERVLGIPTVSDRIAQTVVKLQLEPILDPLFHRNSYGYRPGRSALDAVAMVRRRSWEYDWVVEFDIKGLFDNIDHELMMRALRKHCEIPWILLYVERWLKAPMQTTAGTIMERTSGTPQGGVVSPLLANLFLHYAFDKWVTQNLSSVRFCRYADDGAPRRRTGGRKSSVQPSCTRDEGGPFGVAVQAETSNHLLLLHLRDVVVSESGKGRARPCQIRTVESNANEPLMTCRKRRNDVKTGRESLTRDKSGSNLLTGQTASGIKAARTRFRLLCGTWEPVTPMLREKHKERSSKCQSTDAGYRGGVTCNSDEGSVMELERRGYPIQSETCEQPAMGGFA